MFFKKKKLSKIKKQSDRYLLKRAGWYGLGLLLFYAPFAFFNRALNWLLGNGTDGTIHGTCFRIPIANLLGGKGIDLGSVWGISLLLLLGSAFLIGPFFCSKLCTVGAITEYMSRMIPDKWKIDWTKMVNPVPIRYGFLAGFVIAPLTTGALNCSYCSYGFFERMLTGGFWGEIGALSSATIITALLWIILFGLFTKGGRGYCNFMCPVGPLQSLMHSLGVWFGFTYKLKYKKEQCVSCKTCVKECPMGALRSGNDGKITYSIHHCITCRQCEAVCPTNAITYGRGDSDWSPALMPIKQSVVAEKAGKEVS